jgi:hypothetical protein
MYLRVICLLLLTFVPFGIARAEEDNYSSYDNGRNSARSGGDYTSHDSSSQYDQGYRDEQRRGSGSNSDAWGGGSPWGGR